MSTRCLDPSTSVDLFAICEIVHRVAESGHRRFPMTTAISLERLDDGKGDLIIEIVVRCFFVLSNDSWHYREGWR